MRLRAGRSRSRDRSRHRRATAGPGSAGEVHCERRTPGRRNAFNDIEGRVNSYMPGLRRLIWFFADARPRRARARHRAASPVGWIGRAPPPSTRRCDHDRGDGRFLDRVEASSIVYGADVVVLDAADEGRGRRGAHQPPVARRGARHARRHVPAARGGPRLGPRRASVEAAEWTLRDALFDEPEARHVEQGSGRCCSRASSVSRTPAAAVRGLPLGQGAAAVSRRRAMSGRLLVALRDDGHLGERRAERAASACRTHGARRPLYPSAVRALFARRRRAAPRRGRAPRHSRR